MTATGGETTAKRAAEPPGRPAPRFDDARVQARSRNLLQPLALLASDCRGRMRAGLRQRGHRLLPSQSAVLVHLAIEGSRPSELAARAGMSRQAMGKIVDELAAVGYVEKARDPADGRARLIRFTDRGLDLLSDSARIIDTIWGEYAALVGERRLLQLRDELNGLLCEVTGARDAGEPGAGPGGKP